MALAQYPKIQKIIETGYEFDFGRYINEGFEIFKKDIGIFVGYTAVFLLINLVGAFIPLASIIISPPLIAGFYIGAHFVAKGQKVTFNDFFKGFEYIGQLIALYVVIILLVIALMIPMAIALIASFSSASVILPADVAANPFWMFSQISLWMFVLLTPIIYFTIAWRWALLFIVFYDMGFWDAMEASRRLSNKKWWMIFAFAIVMSVLGGMGYIALLIGFLFTYPAAMCMDYAAFSHITKLQQEASIEDTIETHLIE